MDLKTAKWSCALLPRINTATESPKEGMRIQRHMDRTFPFYTRPHTPANKGRQQLGSRWALARGLGCYRGSTVGRGQLGVASLYLLGHRAHMPELWGDRQLYRQASVMAWRVQESSWHGVQDPWTLETMNSGYSQILSESRCSKQCKQCGMKGVFWA